MKNNAKNNYLTDKIARRGSRKRAIISNNINVHLTVKYQFQQFESLTITVAEGSRFHLNIFIKLSFRKFRRIVANYHEFFQNFALKIPDFPLTIKTDKINNFFITKILMRKSTFAFRKLTPFFIIYTTNLINRKKIFLFSRKIIFFRQLWFVLGSVTFPMKIGTFPNCLAE